LLLRELLLRVGGVLLLVLLLLHPGPVLLSRPAGILRCLRRDRLLLIRRQLSQRRVGVREIRLRLLSSCRCCRLLLRVQVCLLLRRRACDRVSRSR